MLFFSSDLSVWVECFIPTVTLINQQNPFDAMALIL